jgi:hypothetical protein
MYIFTSNNVSAPVNSSTSVNESSTVKQINGNTINTIIETKIPYTSNSNPTATVKTTVITTIAATQLTPESSFVEVTTATHALSVAPVNLIMSDGSINTIFDSVATGLKLLEFMNSRNQYYLQASDDLMVINVDGVKLLLIETSFMNQKLMNSFSFIYSRGKVRCIHRTLASVMSVTDALVSVRYQNNNASAFMNNYDLQDGLVDASRPRIQVFDYKYVANPTASSHGSLLEDSSRIFYG